MSSTTRDGAPETVAGATDIGRSAGRYVLAIHWLSQSGTERISTGELRDSLAVSAASVTEMLARLDDRGLVDYEKYRGVRLTRDGKDLATRLAWRFCVVTNFFDGTLDADLDDETSYQIGVTLPEEGVHRLRGLIDHPCIDECPERSQDYEGCHI